MKEIKIEENKLAKSALQTRKVFEEFIRKNEVVNFVKEYRKELGLPKKGITLKEEDMKEFNEEIIPVLYLPKKFFRC